MARVKTRKRRIMLDMTAMCDMAFLLLAFFILTTKFKPQEAVHIDIPSSTEKKEVATDSLMIISIDKQGKVYLSLLKDEERVNLVKLIAKINNVKLSEQALQQVRHIQNIGIPFSEMEYFLTSTESTEVDYPGIPTLPEHNELITWIQAARQLNPSLKIAIRSDREAAYGEAIRVIDCLRDLNLNRISFITNPETLAASD